MRIEAANLQEAFQKAAEKLGCSVTELDVKQVIQHPSSGFFGFFKKSAIIEVVKEGDKIPKPEKVRQKEHKNDESQKSNLDGTKSNERQGGHKKRNKNKKHSSSNSQNSEKQNHTNSVSPDIADPFATTSSDEQAKPDYIIKKIDDSSTKSTKKHEPKNILDNSIIENFHQNSDETVNVGKKEKKDIVNFDQILPEIKDGLSKLFGASCFDISKIEVSKYSEDSVLIELDGADAALLIGKEGYRYKAISYLLHNWLNTKYNLSIRLEIAEFLKNQEATMDQYLAVVIEKVNANGKAQTKPLDGVLVKIALAKLRERFPDKYVGIKSNGNDKFVVVNDFFKK